jgi:pSer/pThr/pTyr-binding forkhead associated (FHA) protein
VGAPPPLPGAGHAPVGGLPSLFVIFNGQKIPIAKTEFVIGRGSKTADLPIKDGNISRRHAAVVFEGGRFIIKDLGSTNGIEFGGQRVDNKPIDEGDVFQLCDYELRFTYR